MILALTVGALVAGAVFLMLHRDRLRVILGFVLLSHAVNLLLFSAGGIDRREEPLGAGLDPATTADPLPQAFVLTAIVIAFAITIYLLVLAVTGSPADDMPPRRTRTRKHDRAHDGRRAGARKPAPTTKGDDA